MLVALMIMVATAIEKPRRANYERFWNLHHLLIPFFILWAFHGNYCMIPADTAPYCYPDGRFWTYWIGGALVYLAERVMREIRGEHKTYISKVIQHPSKVVEVQMKKEHTPVKAGQVSCFPTFTLSILIHATSISFSAVLRYLYCNIILSPLPVLPRKIIFQSISVVLETLRRHLQKLLAVTSVCKKARRGRPWSTTVTVLRAQLAEFFPECISMGPLVVPPKTFSSSRLLFLWVQGLGSHHLLRSWNRFGIACSTDQAHLGYERSISFGSVETLDLWNGSAHSSLPLKRRI